VPRSIDSVLNPLLPERHVFVAWVVAAHEARLAWDAWLASTTRDRGGAYARYQASLDREEQAAARLATAVSGNRRRFRGTDDLPAVA
jgi:hypothetical protein